MGLRCTHYFLSYNNGKPGFSYQKKQLLDHDSPHTDLWEMSTLAELIFLLMENRQTLRS